MKILKKFFKIAGLSLLGAIVLILVVGFVFVTFSPQFGGTHSNEDKLRYSASGHYDDGEFQNLIPTSMDMGLSQMIKVVGEMLEGTENSRPDFEVPIQKVDSISLTKKTAHPKVIWFGHSAFLLQIDGLNILLDPMLGEVCAPHPWLGQPRYHSSLPIEVEKLPAIDAIIISHDHYDHLDYESIKKLKDKTKAFFMPLGVGAHFRAWGIDEEKINEMNWWDTQNYQSLSISFTPSRHFSGRGLNNRFSTMWGSWIVKSDSLNIYFSGDGGYGPHFKEIGEKFGPFDFAMVECGQYNEQWRDIHLMPEETAQAAVDLNAKVMMPIHWGAFTLALHSWTDPIERVSIAAQKLSMPLVAPVIGEQVYLDNLQNYHTKTWWVK